MTRPVLTLSRSLNPLPAGAFFVFGGNSGAERIGKVRNGPERNGKAGAERIGLEGNGRWRLKMEVKTILVTPEMAFEWLALNQGNRRFNRAKIDRLKQEIKEGRWVTTSQGISFFEDGSLANGQHRLMAIFESEIPCRVNVAFGEKREAALYLDSSEASRSKHDQLKMFGKPWIDQRIVAISRTVLYHSGCFARTNAMTILHIEAFAERFRSECELSRDWIYGPSKRYLSVSPVAGGICYALIAIPERRKEIETFCMAYIEGGAPTLALMSAQKLRDSIVFSSVSRTSTYKNEPREVFLRTLRALSAFLEGQVIQVLKAPESLDRIKMPKINEMIKDSLIR